MEDRCVVCGSIIPEGRMVCPKCEGQPMKPKTIAGIIEEVANNICSNYCKYGDTTDDNCECEAFRKGIGCPLERLF